MKIVEKIFIAIVGISILTKIADLPFSDILCVLSFLILAIAYLGFGIILFKEVKTKANVKWLSAINGIVFSCGLVGILFTISLWDDITLLLIIPSTFILIELVIILLLNLHKHKNESKQDTSSYYKLLAVRGVIISISSLTLYFNPQTVIYKTFDDFYTDDLKSQMGYINNHNADAPDEVLNNKIDSLVYNYLEKKKIVGLAIGIISNGNQYTYGYGRIKKNTEKIPDNKTIFAIGSVTKTFTTSVLGSMLAESKINLHDSLDQFFSEQIPGIHDKVKGIKLVELATHTSGLMSVPTSLLFSMVKNYKNPYKYNSLDDMHEALSDDIVINRGKFEYSNFGMAMLGHVLCLKNNLKFDNGKEFEELVVTRICNKLNMNDTRVFLNEEQNNRFVDAHFETGKTCVHWDIPVLPAAGVLKSTVSDLLKYISANMYINHSELDSVWEICHKTYFEPTDTSKDFDMGLGWIKTDLNKEIAIWHNGATYGNTSFIGFIKEKQIGVVVLSNTGKTVDKLGFDILELLVVNQKPLLAAP